MQKKMLKKYNDMVYESKYILENKINDVAYGFIYITTNLVNGKKYIGQRKFSGTWIKYLGSGKAIKLAIKKYCRKNFSREIIYIAHTLEELNKLEIHYIDLYDAINSVEYYNIASGGKNVNTLAGKTKEEMEEFKRKNRESHLGIFDGVNNPFYGKKHTPEAIKKISESHKEIFIGKNNPNYGKHFSEESKEKMREAKIGLFDGNKNPRARAVICTTTNKIFDTAKAGSIFYNTSRAAISMCCNGKRNHGGKDMVTGLPLKWMFYDIWLNVSKKDNKEI